jgi:sugar phosphate isomerase/epimerase
VAICVGGMFMNWSLVFKSQNIWPANWSECLEKAKLSGYQYIAFNGLVYEVNAANPERPDNSICSDLKLEPRTKE